MTMQMPNNKQSQFSKEKVTLGDLELAFQDIAPVKVPHESETKQ